MRHWIRPIRASVCKTDIEPRCLGEVQRQRKDKQKISHLNASKEMVRELIWSYRGGPIEVRW